MRRVQVVIDSRASRKVIFPGESKGISWGLYLEDGLPGLVAMVIVFVP